jgi:hypothetical protein
MSLACHDGRGSAAGENDIDVDGSELAIYTLTELMNIFGATSFFAERQRDYYKRSFT